MLPQLRYIPNIEHDLGRLTCVTIAPLTQDCEPPNPLEKGESQSPYDKSITWYGVLPAHPLPLHHLFIHNPSTIQL